MASHNDSVNVSLMVALISDTERPIIGALLSLVSVVAFFGNVLVLLAFGLSGKLHHTANYFVVNLSVADLITSLSIPANVVAIVSPSRLADWACLCTAVSAVVCVGCGVYTLACIAVHRLVVVVLGRPARASAWRLVLPALLLTWAVPGVMAGVPVIFGMGEFGYNARFSSCTWKTNAQGVNNYSMALALTYYPIPMLIITACYAKIFLHVRQSRRRVNAASDGQQPRQARTVDTIQTSVTRNMFYVVCAFLLCTTPYTVTLLLPGTSFLVPYAGVVLLASTAINPTIYATKHPEFGKVMRCLATGRFNQIPQFVFR